MNESLHSATAFGAFNAAFAPITLAGYALWVAPALVHARKSGAWSPAWPGTRSRSTISRARSCARPTSTCVTRAPQRGRRVSR